MTRSDAPALDFDTRVRRTCVPMYAVAILSTLLLANLPSGLRALGLPLDPAVCDRRALNIVTIPALFSLAAVWYFP